MSGWSELPPDIINSISLQIDNPFSLIHFRSVCSTWRSFSILKFRPMTQLKCPLPLDSGGCGDDCHILNSRVYLLKSPNSSPRPKYWLFKLGESESGEIVLYNLFLRGNCFDNSSFYPSRLSLNLLDCQIFVLAHEHLACFSEWIEGFESIMDWVEPIGSMGLDRKNNKFSVLGKLSFEGLAMYRSVDECWTELEIKIDSDSQEIVSYKGKFYAIGRTGRTIVVEPTTLEVNTFQRSRPCDKIRKRWLLKSADKLHLVEMYRERGYDSYEDEDTIWFEILKLDEKRNDWDQVEDVDDHVLFLGNYFSFSCLATEIPGLRANSIVFLDMWGTSDNIQTHERISVFELSEHGVRSSIDIREYIELFRTPPGWVLSNE